MSSIASIGRMVSGMVASQVGLQVTGHNISNANTKGYTRQQLLQNDSSYVNIGTGNPLKQIGLGVSMTEIRQIRDEFADKRYRTQNSVLTFYNTKLNATQEVEAILDEPYGESISKFLKDFWNHTQKLSINPSGVDERKAFIQMAHVFAEKANNITSGFQDYQYHLNNQVVDGVNKINDMLHQIKAYNVDINAKECNGDHANDLRDQRNLLLDELSEYMDIDYYEDQSSMVTVKGAGRTLVDKQFVTELTLKQTKDMSPFVKPVWKDTGEDVFKMNRELNAEIGNDNGKLQALLSIRGDAPADLNTKWEEIAINDNKSVDVSGNAYVIPKLQKQFSTFMNELTSTVNEQLTGYGMGDFKDDVGVPVFVPVKSTDGTTLPTMPQSKDYKNPDGTYNDAAYKAAVKTYNEDIKKHLVPGNIKVNPELRTDEGYNKLGTTEVKGNVGDNSMVENLLKQWSNPRKWPPEIKDGLGNVIPQGDTAPHLKENNFMDFYAEYVSGIGTDGFLYQGKVKEKETIVLNVENERQAMGGVSQDEELSNMLKYQYAYNASTRMINVLDSMMDTIINKM